MLNHIDLMGRITKDLELHQTNSGVNVCSFTIACERDFKQGDEKVTDFINVTVWRKNAEFVSNYFHKGSMIVVSGRLESRKYDKDGETRTTFEVQADNVYFGESKRSGSDQNYSNQGGQFSEITDSSDSEGGLPF